MQPEATTPGPAGTEFRRVSKDNWQRFFDAMTKALEGRQVEIEVTGLDLGDQIQVEWLPLSGLTYDPNDDTFYIYMDQVDSSLDHAIPHPREILVRLTGLGLDQVIVTDDDDHRQFVRFREALELPSAKH